jgi:hypothetical protein
MEYDDLAKNTNDNSYNDMEEFGIWLENGINRGWVSDPFCFTHDGDPYMTAEEEQEWEEGGDPCAHVVKIIIS